MTPETDGPHFQHQYGMPVNSCYVKLDYCWHCSDQGVPDYGPGKGPTSAADDSTNTTTLRDVSITSIDRRKRIAQSLS